MIPTLKTGKKTIKGKIRKTILDHGFLLSEHETHFDGFVVFQDKSMNFLQIYTPEKRRSIAIEPMSCLADAFNNKIGLITLKPGKSISHHFGIKLC